MRGTLAEVDHLVGLLAGTNRSRKVSEGMNPLILMMSTESSDQGGFNIIEEESWTGTNSLYGPAGESLPSISVFLFLI